MTTTEDKMNIDERLKYLRKMKRLYKAGDMKRRGELLDEMEEVTELHRKSLIRRMGGDLQRHERGQERKKQYGVDVESVVRIIAESTDYLCAERLTPNLVWLAGHLAAHGELELREPVLEQLGQVSISTVRRIMEGMERDRPRLPRKGPEEANRALRDVPMRRIAWDEKEPGHIETDLVHHCGVSASGEYVYSLQGIDVATGWSERRAILGRSYLVMQDAFSIIEAHLPFPVREIHPDNGSEFFNQHMRRFWQQRAPEVALSRSRPYHKNDNRFVEQKNATLIRAYLGYDRLDTVAQTRALNLLYDKMWLFYNFFQPVMRLSEKSFTMVEGQVTQVKRRYDQARTPFDRLCATPAIAPERRALLEALRDRTNPRQLRQDIYDAITHIFTLPGALPGQTENVFETLSTPPPHAAPVLPG
jgi:hypothetical protein